MRHNKFHLSYIQRLFVAYSTTTIIGGDEFPNTRAYGVRRYATNGANMVHKLSYTYSGLYVANVVPCVVTGYKTGYEWWP